jgi:hypothetical protein
MDALAPCSDEGRGKLRKAPASRYTGIEPEISEWGNPLRLISEDFQLNS